MLTFAKGFILSLFVLGLGSLAESAFAHQSISLKYCADGVRAVARSRLWYPLPYPIPNWISKNVSRFAGPFRMGNRLLDEYRQWFSRQPEGSYRGFEDSFLAFMNITIDFDPDQLDAIPKEGLVLFVANHPTGVLDGITMGYLMGESRETEHRVIAWRTFEGFDEFDSTVAKIVQEESPLVVRAREALSKLGFRFKPLPSRESRENLVKILRQPLAISSFPAASVSGNPDPSNPGYYRDDPWTSEIIARVVKKGGTIVPVRILARNSDEYYKVRAERGNGLEARSMLISELIKMKGQSIRVEIGDPISTDELKDKDLDQVVKELYDFSHSMESLVKGKL